MSLWLIPLEHALPAVQAYLAHGIGSFDELALTGLLERFVRTAHLLIAFSVRVAGRPCQN